MTKRSPFRPFKTSPEIISLAVMLYVRFPLSLRNVEDLLRECGIDVSHEKVRLWWRAKGRAEILKKSNAKARSARGDRHGQVAFLRCRTEEPWCSCPGGNRAVVVRQSGRLAPAIPTTGAGDAALSRNAKPSEAATVHASIFDHFSQQQGLSGRDEFELV